MSAVESIVFNRESIRRVLRAWDSIQTLGAQPLADLNIVQARRQAEGYSDAPAGRGLALQEVLRAALEALRPTADSPDLADRRWRPYLILTRQYVHGRAPDFVAGELHVSRRTYFAEQEQALQAVADVLCKWEEQAASSDRSGGPTPGGPTVPFLAPPRPIHILVGRDDLFADLKHQLLHTPHALIALQGLPGVGKTALAIELAHTPELLAHFADGVLWAGLGRQPEVMALLAAWAAAVGMPAAEIARHTSLAQRAQAVHAAIGLRRMLLVIDDAWQLDAALAFKVGGPNCVHLLTTRLSSIALDFAGDGVIPMHELEAAQGLGLLAQLAPQAVAAEPDEARALVQAVGGLPLALILMGGHLRKQSHGAQTRRLRQALADLREAETRLCLAQPQSPLEQRTDLPADTPLSLQTVIGVSTVALDAATCMALRDLAHFPPKPNTFSEAAALMTLNTPVSVLDMLVDQGLVESVGADRYTLHQTIADYARLAAPAPGALDRWLNYHIQYAQDYAADDAALDRERENLLAALNFAFDQHQDDALIRGCLALQPFLLRRGLYAPIEPYLDHALDVLGGSETRCAERYALLLAREQVHRVLGRRQAQGQDLAALQELAEREGNDWWRAEAALRRAHAAYVLCDYAAAIAAAQQSVMLAQTLGAVKIQAAAHRWWGQSLILLGDYAEARAQCEQALALAQSADLPQVVADSLRSLGQAACDQSEYAEARTYYEQALHLCRQWGNRLGETQVLASLGYVAYHQGDYTGSLAFHEQTLRLKRELGDRRGECGALLNVGSVLIEQGDLLAAQACYEQALQLGRELGARNHEALALNNLGVAALRLGAYARARDLLEQTLHLNGEIGVRPHRVYALLDMGLLLHQLGENHAALDYCQQAMLILQEIGDRAEQARELTYRGHALIGLDHLAEAAEAYGQALALRRALKHHVLSLEPLSGLASIAAAQGKMAQALAQVEEILPHLATHPALPGLNDPFQIPLTCYQILYAHHDPRALEILKVTCAELQERACKIDNESQRRTFLENVAAHRELLREYDKLEADIRSSHE